MNKKLALIITGAALLVIILTISIGFALQPARITLTGNAGYQAIARTYRAGGSACAVSNFEKLTPPLREKMIDRCSEAEEQHRLQTNDLIQYLRAADAAEASARIAYEQTKISAWSFSIGLVTMLSAIFAAFYAKRAADEAQKSTKITKESAAESKRIGYSGLAAYFSVKNVEYTLPWFGTSVYVSVEMFNNGSGPARNYRHFFEILVDVPDLDFCGIDRSKLKNFATKTIGPNAPVKLLNRKFIVKRSDIEQIRKGMKSFYLKIAIEYTNIDGTEKFEAFGRKSKFDVYESSKWRFGRRIFYTSGW